MNLAPKADARSARRHTGVRKPSRGGELTRTKLLDAAELVFADHGYDGTSLRDISEAAGLHLALSTYYFGSKERLFEEVIHRRAVEFIAVRLAGLAQIDPNKLTTSENIRLLIESYAMPILEAAYQRSKQHQAYVRIMARIINVKRWTPLIQRSYRESDEAYFRRWRQALPHAEEASIMNAFSFMVATLLSVCSYTNRFGNWPNTGVGRKKVIEDLIRYSHAGFMTLEGDGAPERKRPKGAPAKRASKRRSS